MKIKAFFAGIVLSLALVAGFNPLVAKAEYQDYYINDLDVDIVVNEDNVFTIRETYVYDFIESHHGPIRSFVLDHYRNHGEDGYDYIKARVKHLRVSSPDAVSDIANEETDGDTYTVYIGDEDETYTGEHTYVFKYDYKIYSKDPLVGKDELYYNIVGTGYDCPIEHVTWTVHMPKDFDTSTIGYSVGDEGSSGYD